ncbi:unnamed protein product [Rotaria socialis]|uniref:protein-tyrosine-phosphatase n=1 Tax=Rotaria socialis TaxID=392032 RepID=A0A820P9F6_9BILA|nr:unnamed protein product [Rotaria socialis]
MVTCVAQQSLSQLLPVIYPPQLYLTTYESEMSSISSRKRLLNEQHDHCTCPVDYAHDCNETNKRTKTESLIHESSSKYPNHRIARSAPGFLRRKSLTHEKFTYIKNVSSAEASNPFLSTTTTETIEKNMLMCQHTTSLVIHNETGKSIDSSFVTCPQLAAYVTATMNITDRKVLVIDCGSPLRHTERRVHGSILLNVNDRISRKRLSTRGLKIFLDSNQLQRLDSNDIIILYDDHIRPSACANETIQSQLAPSMKCVYDEIKRYDTNKILCILESPFEQFLQHYPSLCYVSTSTDEDLSMETPLTSKPADIESYPISEIISGLYLGNSRDAEDKNLLQQNQIKLVINISTSIPCYFENENAFEYIRVPCHDSSNQNILQYFETTFEYIHQNLSVQKNILVHCQGGVSRSPSFIIGYLMKYHSKTFDEAHQLVKDKRSIINPNLNFLGQLTQYEKLLSNA